MAGFKFTVHKIPRDTVTVKIQNDRRSVETVIDIRKLDLNGQHNAVRRAVIAEGFIFTKKMEKIVNKELTYAINKHVRDRPV